MEFQNPFSVVKATEYSDEEILSTWVPFTGSDGKDDAIKLLLNPTELMPKYVLGTKGCGKTHILRYFSYELRNKYYENINHQITKDKYIGIYSRLDGLSSSRFNHPNNQQAWMTLYDYYFELYQSIQFLEVIESIEEQLNTHSEAIITEKIKNYLELDVTGNKIMDIITSLNRIRIKIDRAIIDYAYNQELDWSAVKPICKFGDIIFGIPKLVCECIPILNDIKFIFILDEYEKLPCNWQKESLNTLVYEKKDNVTFWIGARRYGYTTLQTKTSEPIKEGSEFQPVYLDEIIRSQGDKVFIKFANNLLIKRLQAIDVRDNIIDNIESIFETYDEYKFVSSLSAKRNLKHWIKLKKNINKIIQSDIQSDSIVNYFRSELESESPITEKFVLFLFYQKWAKQKFIQYRTLFDLAKEAISDYRINSKTTEEKLKKFRADLLAQLAVENGVISYIYAGLKELITIADFNPRVFLTLMKLITEDCFYKGYNPYIEENRCISVQSQYSGIIETAKWFISDIEVDGQEREQLALSINRLIDYFYVNRFCDKPTETSPCTFYYKKTNDVLDYAQIIQLANNESFIIETDNSRKDKSLGVPQKSYQLNKLIATLYNLPIARRGILPIGEEMFKAIFSSIDQDKFNTLLLKKKQSLNAPFGSKPMSASSYESTQPSLFDFEDEN